MQNVNMATNGMENVTILNPLARAVNRYVDN